MPELESASLPVLFNKIIVIAGGDNENIPPGDYQLIDQSYMKHHPTGKVISLLTPGIKGVTVQTDETIKKLPEAIAWGCVGAIFGPLGVIAGLILGGWGHQFCSLVEFRDGKKFLMVTSEKILDRFIALSGLQT